MYTLWNKQDPLTLAEGTLTPEEVMSHKYFGFTRSGAVVINKVRGVVTEIHSLAVLANNYDIPEDLSDEAALAAIIAAQEAEQNAEPEPSAEERIAAAMEFQNLMSL